MSLGPYSDRVVLAIESSCDETCAAVVSGGNVLSDIVATQAELHRKFGGVVPEIASRRHLELVDFVVREALEVADVEPTAIAVTAGPGLVGALLVGVASAKARSWATGLPLIAVDHLAGHVASALLAPEAPQLPMLCVLVSGGHTLLLDVDENLNIELLGSTRDDAAGEAFDKGARLLGLDMPGGPKLEQAAEGGDDRAVSFTPAMLHDASLDTSFSGVKTALSLAIREHSEIGLADMAASYERAIVETIIGGVRRLLRQRGPDSGHPAARSHVALVGGVAANQRLRAEMTRLVDEFGVEVTRTPLRWCGDNAAMIGRAAGWFPELSRERARTLDAYASSPLFRTQRLMPTTPL